jgi:hypothetical protein
VTADDPKRRVALKSPWTTTTMLPRLTSRGADEPGRIARSTSRAVIVNARNICADPSAACAVSSDALVHEVRVKMNPHGIVDDNVSSIEQTPFVGLIFLQLRVRSLARTVAGSERRVRTSLIAPPSTIRPWLPTADACAARRPSGRASAWHCGRQSRPHLSNLVRQPMQSRRSDCRSPEHRQRRSSAAVEKAHITKKHATHCVCPLQTAIDGRLVLNCLAGSSQRPRADVFAQCIFERAASLCDLRQSVRTFSFRSRRSRTRANRISGRKDALNPARREAQSDLPD